MNREIGDAVAAYKNGDWTAARHLCRQILEKKPGDADALHLLGLIAAQSGEKENAVHLLRRALELKRGDPILHVNLANALAEIREYTQARGHYEQALALAPGYATAHVGLGHVLAELGQSGMAEENYKTAIDKNPHNADLHYNYANLLSDSGRWHEAVDHYEQAIALRPEFVEAFNNYGMALADLERYETAVAAYRRAIALDAEFADAHNNLGIALAATGNYAEAVSAYQKAIAIAPDYVDANWNLALCQLVLGDFARGWKGFEWRWKHPSFDKFWRDFPQPYWLGQQDLTGKTILLHSEQGLGDTLQFCRYARLLAARSARVIMEVQPSLAALLSGLEGAARVIPRGGELPAFDFHCSMMSLPLAFATDLNTIPADVPYLRSSTGVSATWKGRLGAKTKPRIGIVWSGNPAQSNDRNRSMLFSQILPLIDSSFEWISLQKGVRETDAALLKSRADIRHLGDDLEDFADTAGLVDNLDLVISACTSVAHLAGAMGKPVWILLPYNADWRWLLDREDSPWYPDARLFRQPAIGDWAGVMVNVIAGLRAHFGDAPPSTTGN